MPEDFSLTFFSQWARELLNVHRVVPYVYSVSIYLRAVVFTYYAKLEMTFSFLKNKNRK